jgi:hypothetical protein
VLVRGGVEQASVNPKAETVEELQGRRKALHMGMLKLAREDLALALQAAINASVVLVFPFLDICLMDPEPSSAVRPRIWQESEFRPIEGQTHTGS